MILSHRTGGIFHVQHLVLLNPNFLDSVVLASYETRPAQLRLAVVYKDWHGLVNEPNADKKLYRMASVQKFFEEVVSCLAYSVWGRLLAKF